MAAALLAAVLLLPWWLGFALARVGPEWGISFHRYEREGYRQFSLEGAEFDRKAVRVHVETITAETPLLWAWHRWTGSPRAVTVGRWSVEVGPSDGSPQRTTPGGWVPLKHQLEKIAARLTTWLPHAEIGAGSAAWPSGKITMASAKWDRGTLTSPDAGYGPLHASVAAEFPRGGGIRVEATDRRQALAAHVRSEGESIAGDVDWLGQKAKIDSAFAASGWKPLHASLDAAAWRIPADRLKLGAHYAEIAGQGKIEWDGTRLRADVSARSDPRPGDAAPPLTLVARGHGDTRTFVAEALEISLPGVTAHLAGPVEIDRTGRLKSAQSEFSFAAQLSRLPWLRGKGDVRGNGTIAPDADGRPDLTFRFEGENLGVGGVGLTRVSATGRFDWPRLTIANATLVSDGSELSVHGSWDFAEHELINLAVRGGVDRQLFARWLPAYPDFSTLSVDATASGRWPDLVHRGRIEAASVRFPALSPLAVQAEWSGRGFAVEHCTVAAQGGATKLDLEGAADRNHVQIAHLRWNVDTKDVLVLQEPTAVHWRPGLLRVDPVHLAGPVAHLDAALDWGSTGRIDFVAREIRSEWLRDLMRLPPTEVTASLSVKGRWADGPAEFDAHAAVAVALAADRAAHVAADLHGDEHGLQISGIRVTEGEGVIVNVSGKLPLRVRPGGKPLIEFEQRGAFALDAATTENPDFWAKLTELTGVEVTKPEVFAHLSGSLDQLTGEARFHADRITPVAERFQRGLPKIEAFDARITGDSEGIKLDSLSVAIDGQQVRAEGRLPVSWDQWEELIHEPRKLARHGALHLQIPNADLGAVARYVPNYLAPKGRLEVDVTLKADETVTGFLRIKDATSRPLGPLGVLQDVNADVSFEGRAVELKKVSAQMGGRTVTLQGRAELPPGERPRLDFALKGQNLPFVRRTGLLLRGDLDLSLKTSNRGQTTIAGKVTLRDSLFVSDIRSLLPSGTREAERRPPYFSIETEPLNRWRLDVLVEGQRFFRLRTPVFNGTASTRVQLSGTLGHPRASGHAVIDEGSIRLPFASFAVRQGEVQLTPEQPEPQLLVIGTARRYGYDLRLELTGGASSPNLTFSSSPPLEAEQVLLMVMAGQAPNNEINTTDRQRAARFGAFFGQSLLGTLGGDSSNADRLTISSGENISSQGHETYSIEYRLTNRWSLTGEYDEFDDYNGGLKWRIYQKGGSKADEKK